MTTHRDQPDRFLSCDWGTTCCRLRLVDRGQARVLSTFRSNQGTACIAATADAGDLPERFRAVLLQHVAALSSLGGDDLSELPIVISGMASSSFGWHELPYARLPFALDGSDVVWKNLGPLTDTRGSGSVFLVSGVCDDADVMRGEETELLGLRSLLAKGESSGRLLVVLPGTHSKHVTIDSERITGFTTYMTGELFHVLRHQGTLRLSLGAAEELSPEQLAQPPLASAFREGAKCATRESLTAALFRIRANHLLHHREAMSNLAFLSGLLIGSELAGLASGSPNAPQRILCAGEGVHFAYQLAFETLGIGDSVQVIPPDQVDCLAALGHALILNRLLSQQELSPPHLGLDAAAQSPERVADVPLL